MSMPEFPSSEAILTREQAINAILTSIAMEEIALSHIMNAEGEKIQYAIEYIKANNTSCDLHKLLEINKSAAEMLEQITDMQIVLKNKMRLAVKHLSPRPPHPPCPPPKPCPPRPPCRPSTPCTCISIFSAITECVWCAGTTLWLEGCSRCCNKGITHLHKNCESQILLPAGKRYEIELVLDLLNRTPCPICIEVELRCESENICLERLTSKKSHARISRLLIWDTPTSHKDSVLTIRLLSPQGLTINKGEICIRPL